MSGYISNNSKDAIQTNNPKDIIQANKANIEYINRAIQKLHARIICEMQELFNQCPAGPEGPRGRPGAPGPFTRTPNGTIFPTVTTDSVIIGGTIPAPPDINGPNIFTVDGNAYITGALIAEKDLQTTQLLLSGPNKRIVGIDLPGTISIIPILPIPVLILDQNSIMGLDGVTGTPILQITNNSVAPASIVSIGYNATASKDENIAIGADSAASGDLGIAIGKDSVASGTQSLAIGCGTKSIGDFAIAHGCGTTATAPRSIAHGANANASNDGNIAIGADSSASGDPTIAIGCKSKAIGNFSIAHGCEASATAPRSIAHGYQAKALHTSVAIGELATSTADNQIIMGSDSTPLTDMYIANGVVSDTPMTGIIHGTGGTNNTDGGDFIIAGGLGGTLNTTRGGKVRLQTTDSSGITLVDVVILNPPIFPAVSPTVSFTGDVEFMADINNATLNNPTITDGSITNTIINGQSLNNTIIGTSALQNNTTGANNSIVGAFAAQNNTTGSNNTALGIMALQNNTIGANNVAIGGSALVANTSGEFNTAVGFNALRVNTDGGQNVGIGVNALFNATSTNNTAVGPNALFNVGTGQFNIALGNEAGQNLTGTDGNNVMIGNQGLAGDSNTMRLGNGMVKCFISGINGASIVGPGTNILVDANGQLGTVPSSIRYKKNIQPMNISNRIYGLNPVEFDYIENNMHSYGLIAEQVEEIMPEIVVKNENNEIETVQYHLLVPMLLNELIKNRKEIIELRMEIAEFRNKFAEFQN